MGKCEKCRNSYDQYYIIIKTIQKGNECPISRCNDKKEKKEHKHKLCIHCAFTKTKL